MFQGVPHCQWIKEQRRGINEETLFSAEHKEGYFTDKITNTYPILCIHIMLPYRYVSSGFRVPLDYLKYS